MNIVSALMKIDSIRVDYQDKWLVFDKTFQMWVVYQRKYGAKKTLTLCEDAIQDEAIKVLLNG
jgi:hypothetical protein